MIESHAPRCQSDTVARSTTARDNDGTMPDMSVDEQMRILMQGVEYGDKATQVTMEAELRERLATGKPLCVYAGFDPTAADLHLGHLVPMLKLRQFQQLGHHVIFLIGTMTATVGDASDKTAARQMLTEEDVRANARNWLRQAYRVLDESKTEVRYNGDWLAPMSFAEVVQLASNFTVQQFLGHETYKRRIEEGRAHLKRVRHAGPVDLRENIAGEVGFEIDVLNARQRIRSIGPVIQVFEETGRAIAHE